jgi:hypothetical protein
MANEQRSPGGTIGRKGSAIARWKIGDLSALVWLIPCGLAAIYLGVFVVQLPHSIWELGWDSDFASGFTVPETVARTGTGGHTVLGTSALYLPLWFGLLTAKLPLHRELWEIAPTGLFIAAALTIGWSVRQIADRRAAVLAVLMVLIASRAALGVFIAAVAHNTVYPCTALLGAYLIWLAQGRGRGRVTAVVVPLLAAVALGVCLASDALTVVAAILPFTLTAILAGLRRERSSRIVAGSALVTVIVALPIAKLTSTTMFALGYRTNAPSLEVAPLSLLPAHARLLFEGLEQLFNGNLDTGRPGALHTVLGIGCDVAMALTLLTLLVVGVRSAASFMVSGWRAGSATKPKQMAASLHIIYWVGSAVMVCGAYAFSTFLDSRHEAFYVTVIFSAAAVIPLLVRSSSPVRWLVLVGVSIFFTASLVGLTSDPLLEVGPLARYEPQVIEVADHYRVPYGYAGYWDASSLTWSSRERVKVRPVFPCANWGGADLCVFSQETVPSWYAPERRRTFLLVEAKEAYVNALPPGLGQPLAAYRFGPMQMYIYPYDIASRLGPSSDELAQLVPR